MLIEHTSPTNRLNTARRKSPKGMPFDLAPLAVIPGTVDFSKSFASPSYTREENVYKENVVFWKSSKASSSTICILWPSVGALYKRTPPTVAFADIFNCTYIRYKCPATTWDVECSMESISTPSNWSKPEWVRHSIVDWASDHVYVKLSASWLGFAEKFFPVIKVLARPLVTLLLHPIAANKFFRHFICYSMLFYVTLTPS